MHRQFLVICPMAVSSLCNRSRVFALHISHSLSLSPFFQEDRDIFVQTAPRSRDPFPNPPVDVIGTTDTWRPHASPTCNIGYRLDKSNPSVTDCDRCHTTSNLHPLVYVLRCHQAQSLSTCQGSFLAVTQGKFRPIKATKKRGARASERANERGAIMTPAESCPSSLRPRRAARARGIR